MERDKLVSFLDENFEEIEDSCENGLQFLGKESVEKVALAVDARLSTIEKAIELEADLLFVHHPMIFSPWKQITLFEKARLKPLIQSDLNLYGQHLPLDMHPVWGNNVQIAQTLDLEAERDFGSHHGVSIGFSADSSLSFEELLSLVKKRVGYLSHIKSCENSGRICICSGGSWMSAYEMKKGETFITGDPNRVVEILADEVGFNVIFAGHYNTEKFGVKAVGAALEKKGLETVFIDEPTAV